MSKYLTPAQQELLLVMTEADAISKRSEVTKRDEARMSFLLAKMKTLASGYAVNSKSEECRQFFAGAFKAGRGEWRAADMQEGTQTIAYSQGLEGGYLVPNEFHTEVIHGMAQFDPLLNKDLVTLIESGDYSLKPYTIPGWDLSTFQAVKVGEVSQQIGQVPPTVAGTILNGFRYKASLPLTIELEEDSFMPTMSMMKDAYSIAFARGIGVDLILGNGVTAPEGVVTGAPNVYTAASPTSLVLDDFESVYFNVNRFHRAAPKCAWLMNDSVYQMARKATDTVGNPLLKLIKDKETIMGKPVLISPSLGAYNPSLGTQAGSFCVFGDLSHMFVRVSRMVLQRQWQLPGYVENGMALYTGLMRADAKVFDPTSGGVPPIVSASL
jgi:HK97 family phage major capsid protein